jgi:hypothetical protein
MWNLIVRARPPSTFLLTTGAITLTEGAMIKIIELADEQYTGSYGSAAARGKKAEALLAELTDEARFNDASPAL